MNYESFVEHSHFLCFTELGCQKDLQLVAFYNRLKLNHHYGMPIQNEIKKLCPWRGLTSYAQSRIIYD